MKTTHLIISALLASTALTASAQRIDFNHYGRQEAEGLAIGYTAWTFGRVQSATERFATAAGDSITLTLSAVEGLAGNGIRTNYWKQGVVNFGYKLIADMCNVTTLLDPGNSNDTEEITAGSSGLQLVVSGLAAGEHTLLAYHNVTDGYTGNVAPLDVLVNGSVVAQGVTQTVRATKPSECGYSYITFTANGTDDVVIQYVTRPAADTEYAFTAAVLNALVFDEANPITTAAEPTPADQDYHVDADNGACSLMWNGADAAVRHHIYFGTAPDNLQEVAVTTDTVYEASSLTNLNTYYWRVDEEMADGTIYPSDVWSFRPRHLAFPSAGGYGRFANGGRGGKVVFVTNLSDSGEGSFRDAVTSGDGPRTVIFMVSGRIALESRLVIDHNVTVAGQTAPGMGICFSGAPIGVADDNIFRFVRVRLGSGDTADGIGMAGTNHGIVDHCTISWTIDEAFSSRNAKNLTLQRTLICEALSVAGHKNYDYGTDHGFAGSISGGIGSFHHNLLAHNSGRNWSLAGGYDGAGNFQGQLDIFNNVVYNWCRQACYNGAHEVNFVNNYYKRGPATIQNNATKIMLTADPPSSKTNMQRYYFAGNVMPGVFDESNQEKGRTPHYADEAKYDTMYYKQWLDAPFFPSHAKIETAGDAFKSVLSDVGCNLPLFDEHDKRMVRETRDGTYTYVGSVTGHYGLIDNEADCGGYEVYPELSWGDGYDTDQDGMPDWWEALTGSDKSTADNNEDPDNDGFTLLEDYLNWMGEQHAILAPLASDTINLKALFAGYTNAPAYTIDYSGSHLTTAMLDDTLLVVTSAAQEGCIETLTLRVTDGDGSTMERTMGVAVTGDASITGVRKVVANMLGDVAAYEVYTLGGVQLMRGNAAKGTTAYDLRLQGLPRGTYVLRTTDSNGTAHAMKIVK